MGGRERRDAETRAEGQRTGKTSVARDMTQQVGIGLRKARGAERLALDRSEATRTCAVTCHMPDALAAV